MNPSTMRLSRRCNLMQQAVVMRVLHPIPSITAEWLMSFPCSMNRGFDAVTQVKAGAKGSKRFHRGCLCPKSKGQSEYCAHLLLVDKVQALKANAAPEPRNYTVETMIPARDPSEVAATYRDDIIGLFNLLAVRPNTLTPWYPHRWMHSKASMAIQI